MSTHNICFYGVFEDNSAIIFSILPEKHVIGTH